MKVNCGSLTFENNDTMFQIWR